MTIESTTRKKCQNGQASTKALAQCPILTDSPAAMTHSTQSCQMPKARFSCKNCGEAHDHFHIMCSFPRGQSSRQRTKAVPFTCWLHSKPHVKHYAEANFVLLQANGTYTRTELRQSRKTTATSFSCAQIGHHFQPLTFANSADQAQPRTNSWVVLGGRFLGGSLGMLPHCKRMARLNAHTPCPGFTGPHFSHAPHTTGRFSSSTGCRSLLLLRTRIGASPPSFPSHAILCSKPCLDLPPWQLGGQRSEHLSQCPCRVTWHHPFLRTLGRPFCFCCCSVRS